MGSSVRRQFSSCTFCKKYFANCIFSFPPATQDLAFVFMVGDGILNATLHSPMPLNDNEWHFVQAELNVKLARIKVDYQPWAVKRFPPQTFITMKFTHPLIVGRFPEVYLEISKYKNDTN